MKKNKFINLLILSMTMLVYSSTFSQSIIRITTNTQNWWSFDMTTKTIEKAKTGHFTSTQLSNIISNIGQGNSSIINSSNIVWSRDSICSKALIMDTFEIADTICIDSVKYWIQGDNSISKFKIGNHFINSTSSTNFTSGYIDKSFILKKPNFNIVELVGDKVPSSSSYFLVGRIDIIYHKCP